MEEVDVSYDLENATLTPQVAAQNIKDATLLNVSPDMYDEMKVSLKPVVDEAQKPPVATPTVAETMGKGGRQISSVIKPDIERLNYVEKQMEFMKRKLQSGDTNRRRNEAAWDLMWAGPNPSDDLKMNLADRQIEVEDEQAELDKFNLNFFEQAPSEVVNVGADYIRGLRDNYKVALAGTGASTALGAGLGLVIGGPPGAIAGGIAAARLSAPYAVRGASFVDSVKQSSGGVFAELDMSDKSISFNDKRAAALGAGVIVGTLDMIGEAALIKAVPLLAELFPTPKAAAKFLANNPTAMEAMKNFGNSKTVREFLIPAATEGATEALQEFVEMGAKISVEAKADGMNNVDALIATLDRLTDLDSLVQASQAGFIGALAGGGFVAGGRVASNFVNLNNRSTFNMVEDAKQRATPEPTVEPIRTSDMVVQDEPRLFDAKGVKALTLNLSVAEIAEATKNTNFKKLTPEQHTKILQDMERRIGVRNVFVDPEAVNKWASKDAEKQAKILRKIDPSGTMQPNTPIQLKVSDAVEIEQEYQGFASLLKPSPEGISGETYMQAREAREQASRDLLKRVQRSDQLTLESAATEAVATGVEEAGDVQQPVETGMSPLDVAAQVPADQMGNDLVVGGVLATQENADAVIAQLQNNPEPTAEEALLLDTAQRVRDGLPSQGLQSVSTDTLISASRLTPNQQTELQARGDIKLSELTRSEKPLTDAQLEERVVTKERANWLVREIDQRLEGAETPDQKLVDLRQRLTDMSETLPSFDDGRMRDIDIFGEQDYLNQPTFTNAIAGVLSQSEVDRVNEKLRSARLEVVESIDNAAELEMNQVVDAVTQIAEQEALLVRADEIENNPNIEVVENYLNNKFIGDVPESVQERINSGKKQAVQINPDFLDDVTRAQYGANPVLQQRKIFNKKTGLDPLVAAKIFGFNDAEAFLQVMATTPTREAAMNLAAEVRGEIRTEAEFNTDLNEAAISKAYNKVAQTHLDEMKIMLSKSWPTVRGMFRRIALPIPTINDLKLRAREKVMTTKVGDLNVNQYKVGERKAQGRAVKDITEMKVESAFRNKESAALNAQLANETHKAIGQVNRAFGIIAKLQSPRVQEQLRKAGKTYENVGKLIRDIYLIDDSDRRYADFDQYQKYLDKLAKEGNFPAQKLNVDQLDKMSRQHIQDLTVEEAVELANIAQGVMQRARMKNVLMNKYEKIFNSINTQATRDAIRFNAQKNPNYDVNREFAPMKMGKIEAFVDRVSGLSNLLKNIQFITIKLDNGKTDGYFSRLIFDALRGVGEFDDKTNGLKAAVDLQHRFDMKLEKAIEKYGSSEYYKMNLDKRFIPEFQNNKLIGDGKGNVTKGDLFEMAKHIGNAYNLKQLGNYGPEFTRENLIKILEAELTQKDLDFIQENYWNSFNETKPLLAEKERERNGVEPQWTEPVGFTMFGKEYEGGYHPIKYRVTATSKGLINRLREQTSMASGEKLVAPVDHEPLHGIVSSPHTKERVGAEYLVNLDPSISYRAMNDVIYDITMRDPVQSTMKILQDKDNAREIIRVVGLREYNSLVNMVAEATRSQNSRMLEIFNDQSQELTRMSKSAQAAIAVTQIAFNIRSMLIQFDSMRQVLYVMGAKSGTKHLLQTMSRFVSNPLSINDFRRIVIEEDPGVKSFFESVDAMQGFSDLVPSKSTTKVGYYFKTGRDAVANLAMEKIMGNIDTFMKVGVYHAAYSQYISGEAPRMEADYVSKLSREELDRRAKGYASKVLTRALTTGTMLDRAIIQKLGVGELISYYWNDGRNNINNALQDVRNIRSDMRAAVNAAVDDKNYEPLYNAMSGAAGTVMTRLILGSVGLYYKQYLAGLLLGQDDEEDKLLPKDDETLPGYVIRAGFHLFNQEITDNLPIARNFAFAYDVGQAPQELLGRAGKDLWQGSKAGGEYVYDIINGMTFEDAYDKLNFYEKRAMARSFSYLSGGVPINAMFNYLKFFEDGGEIPLVAQIPLGLMEEAVAFAKEKLEERGGGGLSEEEIQRIIDADYGQEPPPGTTFKDDLQNFVNQYEGKDRTDIDDDEYEVIAQMESAGGEATVNPFSSARGRWQFTEGTWADIRSRSKAQGYDLGLTKEGRFDDEQQDIAMRWWTQNNIKELKNKGIEPTLLNVYGAHHFGVDGWEKILDDPKAKLDKVLSYTAQKSNGFVQVKDTKGKYIPNGYKVNVKRLGGKAPKTAGDIVKIQLKKIQEAKGALEID